jgi:uncharacterized protein DUF6200
MAATADSKAESSRTIDTAASGPLVVDLGKKRRKLIKRLRKGEGKLMDEINHLVEELKTAGSISASTQPLVVVVRQKRRTKSLGTWF